MHECILFLFPLSQSASALDTLFIDSSTYTAAQHEDACTTGFFVIAGVDGMLMHFCVLTITMPAC